MVAKKTTKKKQASKKAWAGRFTKGPDPLAEAYSTSIHIDLRMLPFDIMGSKAHAEMLGCTGIISKKEMAQLQKGLDQVYALWQAGKVKSKAQDEDVHMLVERMLYDLIGPVAGKLHTARSRNDQVITDFKLYLKVEVACIIEALQDVQKAILQLAQKHMGWIMPGYTHLQVAQPVLVSHWLLAHLEAFYRDEKRFEHLMDTSLDECPLGAAAMGGTGHPIDRKITAELLGFSKVSSNSMDTVAERDFCLEFLSAGSICGIHLSRLAEELVLFSSSEFKFVTVDQGFATGSSIMPQKRNPDIAELLRGRSGQLTGALMTLLTTMKGLPLTYNRDLQEDKEPVFKSGDTLRASLSVLAPMIQSLKLHKETLEKACQKGFPTATEAADHLVKQGIPFREAHEVVGQAVTAAAKKGTDLVDYTIEEWKQFHPAFQKSILKDVSLETTVQAKRSIGGTAPNQVKNVIKKQCKRLNIKFTL